MDAFAFIVGIGNERVAYVDTNIMEVVLAKEKGKKGTYERQKKMVSVGESFLTRDMVYFLVIFPTFFAYSCT